MKNILPLLHNKANKKGLKISLPEDDESTNDEISEFSSLLSEVQSNLKFIENKNDELIELRNEIENIIDSKKETEISEKMNKIISDVQIKQKKIKIIIDNLNEQLTEINKNKKNKNNTEFRIKQNLFGSITKKYQNIIIKFNSIENEIKNIIQIKMIRKAEIALGHDLNEKEKNDILNAPKMVQKIYEKKLTGAAHVKLINTINDLEERNKEIKNLEKSIIKLHNLIIELNKLVYLQGEMIDNIEQNIKQAKDYVLEAEGNINESLKNVKKCIIF